MSVNENLRGIPDYVLNGGTNGRLGLFWAYIFAMTTCDTRSMCKYSTKSMDPP